MASRGEKITAVATAGTAVLVGGVAAATYHYRPCEWREGCHFAASMARYNSDYQIVRQSFDIQTGDSLTKVYNFTPKNLGKTVTAKAIGFYESYFSRPRGSTEQIAISMHQRPTDIAFVGELADSPLHYVLDIKSDGDMPAGQSADGMTFYSQPDGAGTTVSIIRTPAIPNGNAASAQDVLFTEACQAIVDVKLPAHSKATALERHLGQETICNSWGAAMTDAAGGDDYEHYTADIKRDSSLGAYVSYGNNSIYPISLDTLPRRAYDDLTAAMS